MANLGSDNTPIEGESFGLPSGYSFDEENGDLVIRDTDGTVAMRRADGTWELESDLALNENDISGVGAFDSESVNTGSLENGVAGAGNTITTVADNEGEFRPVVNYALNNGGELSTTSTDFVIVGDRIQLPLDHIGINTNVESQLYVSITARLKEDDATVRLFDAPATAVSGSGEDGTDTEIGAIAEWDRDDTPVELRLDDGTEAVIDRAVVTIWERIE